MLRAMFSGLFFRLQDTKNTEQKKKNVTLVLHLIPLHLCDLSLYHFSCCGIQFEI